MQCKLLWIEDGTAVILWELMFNLIWGGEEKKEKVETKLNEKNLSRNSMSRMKFNLGLRY
jgi:hypothetical protein